jgi:hypothetical protein
MMDWIGRWCFGDCCLGSVGRRSEGSYIVAKLVNYFA